LTTGSPHAAHGTARAKARPDFTVIGTFALCPRNELAVLDIYRDDKIEGPDQVPLMGSLRTRHGAGRIGIEAVQLQWTSVQAAVRAGLPAVPILRGRESKETRAWVVAARLEVGAVFFREGALWLDALENELLLFPAGPHDDQVDVLSDAGTAVAEAIHRPIAQGVQV
jgi:predicted phage terminase large subunit-like protein